MPRTLREVPKDNPFAVILDEAMRKHGIQSLTELAERTNGQVSAAYLSLLRSGKRTRPTIKVIDALMKALNGDESLRQRMIQTLPFTSPPVQRRAETFIAEQILKKTTIPGPEVLSEGKEEGEIEAFLKSPQQKLKKPCVIYGTREILESAIRLLASASSTPANDGKILMTFQGVRDLSDPDLVPDELCHFWKEALKRALQQRWAIVHLIRSTKDLHRMLNLVSDMIDLIGVGLDHAPYYHQYYFFPEQGNLLPFHDLMVVPQKGALLLFSTQNKDWIDTAFFYPDKGECSKYVEALQAHFYLLQKQSSPLFTFYPEEKKTGASIALTKAEEEKGERFLLKGTLTALSTPIPILEERAKDILKRNDDVAQRVREYINLRWRRKKAFREQVQFYRFRDIYPKKGIKKFADGEPEYSPDDTMKKWGLPQETPEQRLKYLQELMEFLQIYPNYEIGLVDEDMEEYYHLDARTFWEVKGDRRVFLDIYLPNRPQGEGIFLEIREPTIVNAFREHFLDLWERLPFENKDKRHVLAWLQGVAADLQKQISQTQKH